MATIKPFKGIRPPKNLVEKVASRPYDVLNLTKHGQKLQAIRIHFITSSSRK